MPEAPESSDAQWTELMGKDLQMKTIAETDKDALAVQPQDVVVVDFCGYQADNVDCPLGEKFCQADSWMVVIGEKDVVAALEMGIRFMKVGETAEIYSHSKYAYGPGERRYDSYTLPTNSNVKYTVTVQKILPESDQNLDVQIQLCASKKNIANDIYRFENMDNEFSRSRALSIYKRSSDLLDYMLQQNASNETIRKLLLDVLNNIATVHLKAKSYHAAKEACVNVLQKDPTNIKALLRAAKASLLDPASSYTEVEASIIAAEEHVGDDEILQKELDKLRSEFVRQKRLHRKKEKVLYQKMAQQSAKSSDNTNTDELSTNENDAASSADESKPTKRWTQWPWRDKILPYVFQLILFVSMYYYYTSKKQHADQEL